MVHHKRTGALQLTGVSLSKWLLYVFHWWCNVIP